MEDILVLISTYGFPMVMAVYLLVRLEPLIRSLKESVDSLSLLTAMQNYGQLQDIDREGHSLKSVLELAEKMQQTHRDIEEGR